VVAIARQLQEKADTDTFKILADALEDAGCEDMRVINHVREGCLWSERCWVVKMLIGRDSNRRVVSTVTWESISGSSSKK
jgi:hypothetical protein